MAEDQGIMGILSQIDGKQLATDVAMGGLLGPAFGGRAVGAPGRFDSLYGQLQGAGSPVNQKDANYERNQQMAALGLTATDAEIEADAEARRKALAALQKKEIEDKQTDVDKSRAAMESAWGMYAAMLVDIRRISADFDRAAQENPALIPQHYAIQKAAADQEYKALLAALASFPELEKALKKAVEEALGAIDDADYELNRMRLDKRGRVIAERAPGQKLNQADMALLASTTTGTDVGSLVSGAGGGPLGAVFGAVASGAAYDALEGLFDQVLEIYTDLPEEIGKLSSKLVPDLIRAAPEMAAAFTVLGPAVVKELVASAPEIFSAVIDALLDLPKAFAEAIADVFSLEIGGKEVGLGNLDADGGAGRTLGGAAAGFLVGGPVGAVIGAGIGAATGGGKNKKNGGGGNGITINNVTAPNARSFMRELRQMQGSYGYNESLDPAAI